MSRNFPLKGSEMLSSSKKRKKSRGLKPACQSMTRKTIAKFHSFRIRDIETKKKEFFQKSNFRPSIYLYFSYLKGDLCIALKKDCV